MPRRNACYYLSLKGSSGYVIIHWQTPGAVIDCYYGGGGPGRVGCGGSFLYCYRRAAVRSETGDPEEVRAVHEFRIWARADVFW